eukprot:scaffold7736_cov46-Attheya_sp.AAC.4
MFVHKYSIPFHFTNERTRNDMYEETKRETPKKHVRNSSCWVDHGLDGMNQGSDTSTYTCPCQDEGNCIIGECLEARSKKGPAGSERKDVETDNGCIELGIDFGRFEDEEHIDVEDGGYEDPGEVDLKGKLKQEIIAPGPGRWVCPGLFALRPKNPDQKEQIEGHGGHGGAKKTHPVLDQGRLPKALHKLHDAKDELA